MKRADPASALTIPITGFMRARLLAVTNRLAVLSFAVVAAGMFSQHVFAQNPCDCWIDAKTGLPVPTVPTNLYHGDYDAVGQGVTSTVTSRSGQNFARGPDGTWVDAKTGQCVPTVPTNLYHGDYDAVGQGVTSTVTSRSGQNFARVPCPPPSTPATAAPPGGTQPQTGSPDAPPATPVQQEPQPSGGVSVPSFGFGGFGHGSDRGGSKGDKR